MQPFWNDELRDLWFSACQAEKQYLNFKITSKDDLHHKNILKNVYKNAQAHFDKKFRFYKRKYNNKHQNELYDLAAKNSADIWAKIKKLNSPPTRPPLEIIKEDNTISSDIKEILERWHRDISHLFSGLRENPEIAFNDAFYSEILSKREEFENLSEAQQSEFSNLEFSGDILNNDIKYEEVSRAIDRTKIGKAYLEIPNDVIKNLNAKILLHKFYNICFKSGLNPTDWSYSDIKPIPKPDKDSRDPLENRCITILCCIAKVYSSILNSRIKKYLEENKLLVEEQNGFRSSRSCIDHIFVLVTMLRNRKEMGKETFLAFIDYKKAFDSVERNCLFYKLAKIGIKGRMYQAISSLYSNPKSRVVLGDYMTEYFDCPIGVKQGDCLSPTLFSIFINDLACEIKNSNIGIKIKTEGDPNIDIDYNLNVLLYADDIVCAAESENDLQDILFIIENWCKKWRLEINLTKTNILHVRSKRKQQSNFTFLFDMKPVPYCKYYKYLGININEYLDFKFTVEKLSESAGRALGTIITKMIRNNGFPYNLYSMLYRTCVTSVADYSAAVTGFPEYDSSMKVHLRAIRAFLGVPKNACNVGILSETDLLLPKYRTNIQIVRYYHHLMCMDSDKLTKQVYLWDKHLNNNNIVKTWTSEVRQIFEDCNSLDTFLSNRPFELKSKISQINSEFKIKQVEYLRQECREKPKLRTFNLFKMFQEQPAYITKPLSFHLRRIVAKTRLGCLPLRLETGRYSVPRLAEHQRTCLVCKNPGQDLLVTVDTEDDTTEAVDEPIESEVHFMFQCSGYTAERESWYAGMTFPDNFHTSPINNKLDMVFNHPNNIKQTAQYLNIAFNKRSKILNQ